MIADQTLAEIISIIAETRPEEKGIGIRGEYERCKTVKNIVSAKAQLRLSGIRITTSIYTECCVLLQRADGKVK